MRYKSAADLPPRYQKQAEAKIGDLRDKKDAARKSIQKRKENRSERTRATHGGSCRRKNKYGNHKIEIDGQMYDSIKEAQRYAELKILEEAGIISGLRTQVSFELIPQQKDENGRIIERAASYVADFVYTDALTGDQVVEDVKGYKKGAGYNIFVLKRKMMLHRYGVRVKEI